MDQKKIGLFIAQERKQRNMTQQELADRLHVTNKAVSKWETGKSLPDGATLEPLAKELGVSVDELLAGERRNEGFVQAPAPAPQPAPRKVDVYQVRTQAVKNAKRMWQGAALLWAGWLVIAAQFVEAFRNDYYGVIGSNLLNSLSAEDWTAIQAASGGEYQRIVFPGIEMIRWEGETAWILSFVWGYFMCKPWMFALFLAAVAAIVAGIRMRGKAMREKMIF